MGSSLRCFILRRLMKFTNCCSVWCVATHPPQRTEALRASMTFFLVFQFAAFDPQYDVNCLTTSGSKEPTPPPPVPEPPPSSKCLIFKRLIKLTSFCSVCWAVHQLSHMVEILKASMTFFFVFQSVGSPQIDRSCDTTSISKALTPPTPPMPIAPVIIPPGGAVPLAMASAMAAAAVPLAASSVCRILRRFMRFTNFCSLCSAAVHLGQIVESLNKTMIFFLVFHIEISPQNKFNLSTTSTSNSLTLAPLSLLCPSSRCLILSLLMKLTSFCSLCPALIQLCHMGEVLKRSITFFLVFHIVGSPHHAASLTTTSSSKSLCRPSPSRARFSE
mmetsp:Transcript_29902/g.43739  ORF Transcript_29902/g.43739 Transcript_29902/m.43739 type:complete len:331 (+) Transcript_29902:273-1265(+)